MFSKSLLPVFLLCFIGLQTASSAKQQVAPKVRRSSSMPLKTYCPFQWGEFGEYCYGLRLLSLTWEDALSACDRSKSQLVNIYTLDELDFVLQLVRKRLSVRQQSTARIWTSLSTYKSSPANNNLNWFFTNSSRKPAREQILRALRLNVVSPRHTTAMQQPQCAYVDIGQEAPNGAGFTTSCNRQLPAGIGIVHGYICKQHRLPAKGSFFGDLFVPDDAAFAGLQHDAISNNQPPRPGGYWPTGESVPYEISDEFPLRARGPIIRKALRTMETDVCGLKFRQLERGDAEVKDFIRYEVAAGSGICASPLGRTKGRLIIMLSLDCLAQIGTVIHETMHALGVPHEHQRPDRDQHIKINWDNIVELRRDQFAKYTSPLPVWTNNIPYDFASLMHYGVYDFSELFNKLRTIDVLDKVSQKMPIRQRQRLSERDVEKLSNLFPCDKRTGKPKKAAKPIGGPELTREQLIPPVKRNAKCNVEFDRDIISGVALDSPTNQPKEACCDFCFAEPKCRGFAWNDAQNGTCYLKTASGPIIQVDKVVAGYVISRQNESVNEDTLFDQQHCTTLYGIDIQGGEAVGTISGQYASACCRLCRENEKCKAYTWSEWNSGTCFLKSASKPQIKSGKKNLQSGVIVRSSSPSNDAARQQQPKSASNDKKSKNQCVLEQNKDITAGEAAGQVSNVREPDGCCQHCRTNAKCRGFAWNNYDGGTCWLKSVSGPLVAGVNVTAGYVAA